MKFEKPYMEISMFDKADLITTSSPSTDADMNAAVTAAQDLAQKNGGNTAVFRITF